jgi:hypothetical protein
LYQHRVRRDLVLRGVGGNFWAAEFSRLGNDAPEHNRRARFLREARVLPAFFKPPSLYRYDYRLTPRFFENLALTVLGMTNSDLSQIV